MVKSAGFMVLAVCMVLVLFFQGCEKDYKVQQLINNSQSNSSETTRDDESEAHSQMEAPRSQQNFSETEVLTEDNGSKSDDIIQKTENTKEDSDDNKSKSENNESKTVEISQKTDNDKTASKGSGQASKAAEGNNNGQSAGYPALETRIREISQKYKATGMTVAVVRNGKIDWVTSYGYADKEKGIAASNDTVYRIASISKTVSAMVLMTLWDQGLVELDKDVGEYLGFPVRNPNYPDKPITVRSLLIHTSSISDLGTYNKVVDSGEYLPLKDMLTPGTSAFSSSNFYKFAPGLKNFSYSNFGSGIIAAVVESITGKRFSDYAIEAVFKPLGIDASFLPNDISNHDKIANIYNGSSLSYGKTKHLRKKKK